MKRLMLAVVALGLALVLALAGGAAYLAHSIDTPAFKSAVLERAAATVGTDVKVRDMSVSLLSGVTLEGVAVANPRPFAGNLLTADALVLRYRLRPLLSGRLEVERLDLEKPRLDLAMDARGIFNYEKLGSPAAARKSAAVPSSGAAIASPVELVLRSLRVQDALIVMKDPKAVFMKVEDAGLDAAFRVTEAGAQGAGKATIKTLNLADTMYVRGITAPIRISKQSLVLAPIRGKLAGGDLTGEARVELGGGFRYTTSLEARGVPVETLLEEARYPRGVGGRLVAKASFEGTGGLPTMKGSGNAEIADCKVSEARVLSLLSTVLEVPELARPDFDQCLVDFRLAASRVHTPRVRLVGKEIQLTGSGVVNLESSTLDYQMTLALARPLFNKITARELRGAFEDRGDGFSTVDFKIYGSTLAPQTDLVARIGQAAVAGAVERGLGRLFGKKKQ